MCACPSCRTKLLWMKWTSMSCVELKDFSLNSSFEFFQPSSEKQSMLGLFGNAPSVPLERIAYVGVKKFEWVGDGYG